MPDCTALTVYDTHCHYEGHWPQEAFARLIEDARAQGLADALVCPHDGQRLGELAEFSGRFDLSFALGVHPFEWQQAAELLDAWSQAVESHGGRCAAIGEIGLDFAPARMQQWCAAPGMDRQAVVLSQTALFEEQLAVALGKGLPVSVHAFCAMAAVLKSIDRVCGKRPPAGPAGVIHAFNGSAELAREFVRRGFKLGFGGTLTYPGSVKIRRLFAQLDPGAWVLETDAPWIAGAPRRARQADLPYSELKSLPADIFDVLAAAAQVRGITVESAARLAAANTLAVFARLKRPEGGL